MLPEIGLSMALGVVLKYGAALVMAAVVRRARMIDACILCLSLERL